MIAVVALVVSWGPYAICSLVLSGGIGVWCMMLYQSAGKKGWLGFLLGFALTFVFFIVGAGASRSSWHTGRSRRSPASA